jgi:hypothetical protein
MYEAMIVLRHSKLWIMNEYHTEGYVSRIGTDIASVAWKNVIGVKVGS